MWWLLQKYYILRNQYELLGWIRVSKMTNGIPPLELKNRNSVERWPHIGHVEKNAPGQNNSSSSSEFFWKPLFERLVRSTNKVSSVVILRSLLDWLTSRPAGRPSTYRRWLFKKFTTTTTTAATTTMASVCRIITTWPPATMPLEWAQPASLYHTIPFFPGKTF